MTDTPTDTAPEAITQADREAAAAVVEWHNHAASQWEVTAESTTLQFFVDSAPASMRAGAFDGHDLVQFFARHRRLTSHSAGEGLREALGEAVSILERLPYGDWPGGMYSGKTVAANAFIRRCRKLLTPPSDAGSTTRSGGEGVEALIEQEAIDLIVDLIGPGASQSGTNCRVVEDHLRQFLRNVSNLATAPSPDSGEALARAYFERGFICCAAWSMTKPGEKLSDDVIEHAWAHRDEGMDEEDLLPALATTPSPDASPDSGRGLRDQIARDAALFAALPAAEQSALRRELATVGCNPGIVFGPSPSPAIVKEAGEVEHGLGPHALIIGDEPDGFVPVALLIGSGTVYLQQEATTVFLGFKQAASVVEALAALSASNAAQVSK